MRSGTLLNGSEDPLGRQQVETFIADQIIAALFSN